MDHLGQVKNSAVIEALEERLVAALRAEQSDAKIALVCPDQIEQRDCIWYQVSGLRRGARIQADLPLSDLYDYLRTARNGQQIERKHLRSMKLIGFDEDGVVRGASDSLLAYLVFETEHDGKRYVLQTIEGAGFDVAVDWTPMVTVAATTSQLAKAAPVVQIQGALLQKPRAGRSGSRAAHRQGGQNP